MKLIKDYMKKKSHLKEDVKKLNEDIDDDFEEDEDDDWEDEEYEYTVEVDLPCFVRAYITTNVPLSEYEIKDRIGDWLSCEEYANGTAGVEFYGDEIEDYEIETIEISDYIDRVTVNGQGW